MSDFPGGEAADGAYVSPMMQLYNGLGGAGSSVASNIGQLIEKLESAEKAELDADGQLFDTYAGEQSQFYGDADKNTQRALSLLSSLVGQIFNTNSAIIGSIPR